MSVLKYGIAMKWFFTFCTALSLFMVFPAYAEDSPGLSTGKNVYVKICAYCHDIDVGPALKGRKLPPEYTSHIVRNGFRAMPAFPEPYISNEDLKYLGQYIQQSAPEKQ